MNIRRLTLRRAWRTCSAVACLTVPGLLASCSQDDRLAEGGSPSELAFSVRADGYQLETRGTPQNSVSGTAGLLGYKFTDEWASDDRDFIMYNEVLQGSNTTWKTSKSYLLDQDKKMRFYAYFPYQKDVTQGMIQMSVEDASIGIPYFTYNTPTTADEQKDLMWATSEDVGYNAEGKLEPIELQFHHLLSALKFTVTNGFDNGTIKSIKLSKIHNTCRFNYETGVWAKNGSTTIEVSQDLNVPVTTKNTSVLPLTSETQYFMLLPQTLEESAVLTMVYTNGVRDFTLTFALGKARWEDGEGTKHKLEFKQGQVTTLNINVTSVTKMAVNCKLSNWGDGPVFGGDDATTNDMLFELTLDDWQTYQGTDPATGASTVNNIVTGPKIEP